MMIPEETKEMQELRNEYIRKGRLLADKEDGHFIEYHGNDCVHIYYSSGACKKQFLFNPKNQYGVGEIISCMGTLGSDIGCDESVTLTEILPRDKNGISPCVVSEYKDTKVRDLLRSETFPEGEIRKSW